MAGLTILGDTEFLPNRGGNKTPWKLFKTRVRGSGGERVPGEPNFKLGSR